MVTAMKNLEKKLSDILAGTVLVSIFLLLAGFTGLLITESPSFMAIMKAGLLILALGPLVAMFFLMHFFFVNREYALAMAVLSTFLILVLSFYLRYSK